MASPIEWLNEFQVNTGTADTPATSDPQVIGLQGGNYLVAWTEADTTGVATNTGLDIIGKIFDAEGNVVRDSYRINDSNTIDNENDFDIAATNDGGFILVFVDNDISNPAQEAIIWQKKDASGNITNSRTIASDSVAADLLSNPKVVVNNNDNSSYVVFGDNVGGGAGNDEIRAVRLDATGTIVTAEFDAATNSPGQFSRDAEAAINTNGELITVYEEDDSGFSGIELRIMNTAGVNQHAVNVVVGSATIMASDPHVATLSNGNIAVTWVENGNDVYYAVYDSNAGLVQAKTAFTSLTANTNEPSIAALPQGGFVIIVDNDSVNSLQARRYNNDGTTDATDTIFTVESLAGLEITPNVTATADGRILFTWAESGNVFSNIWDTRGGAVDANDFDGLPLNFVETSTTTTNVIDTTLTGDSDADTILGQSGDDSITGGSAADSIEGGAGNDTIDGGLFVDTVNGGTGNDSIVISAGNAADIVNGGSGTDTLDYSASALSGDLIFTGLSSGTYIDGNTFSSIEVVKAGTASTTIDLFFGTQNVDGGAGDDLFLHGDGEFIDNLAGGAGVDTLDLSAELGDGVNIDQGAGTWTGLGGTRTISGFEEIIGTQADDTINIGFGIGSNVDAQGGDDLVFANNGLPEVLNGGTGNDTLDTTSFGGNYAVNLTTGVTNFPTESFVNFENIVSGSGNDTITGTSGDNAINTGAGNDRISSGLGDDTVNGGDGADTIFASNGDDSVLGGNGDDLLIGQNGNDTLLGEAGNDSLSGFAGADSIQGGLGNDTLSGGTENDTLAGEAGNDQLFGGANDDLVSGGLGRDNIGGEAGNDTLSGGDEADTIDGGAGTDSIDGDAGDDRISGGDGDDTINGGDGDDVVFASAGNDLVNGGNGNDQLVGQDGSDTLNGGADNDTLTGFGGADTINGGDGNDSMSGGDDNDRIVGGDGHDSAFGGNGNDLIFGENGNDLLIGQNGDDSLYGQNGDDTISGFAGDDFISGSIGNDSLSGGADNDRVFGGTGNDSLFGGTGNDSLEGGTGADNIGGEIGDDTILGGDDNDTIDGGAGADELYGDNGNDRISGGAGNDTINTGAGNDTVFASDGDDLVFGLGGDDLLIGQNGNDTINGGAGSDNLKGFAGDDVLNGSVGNDTVSGGTGKDRLVVDAGEGGDVLFGGADADTFDFQSGFVDSKIQDFEGGLDVVDLADVTTANTFGDLTISYGGGGTSATVDVGGGDQIIFNNLTAALNAGDFNF